ncbi:hypothetical protein RN001_016150 [Aquatica leii]|uniref:DDE Tnp4 domain-containing protein n=1 Tax=Aquatica leii TaxID=1421715 RepID=A0AAN7S603_9COLE|nr:hypothetical protein RN001_016150 [Aquatica leii]
MSGARNVVENAFSLIAARFRMFHTALAVAPKKINVLVLAACVLHNFLRRNSKIYATKNTFDHENSTTHPMENGDWRLEGTELTGLARGSKRNSLLAVKTNKLKYCQYFNGNGKVEWQPEVIKAVRA